MQDARDVFASGFDAEIELDPGFDDLDCLDSQVDALFARSHRETLRMSSTDEEDFA